MSRDAQPAHIAGRRRWWQCRSDRHSQSPEGTSISTQAQFARADDEIMLERSHAGDGLPEAGTGGLAVGRDRVQGIDPRAAEQRTYFLAAIMSCLGSRDHVHGCWTAMRFR